MEGEIEHRVKNLEEGMREMFQDNISSKNFSTQFAETLKELSASFKQISETNIGIQKTMEFLQKEIERSTTSQEKMNKKIDDIARFSVEVEKLKDAQRYQDEKQSESIKRVYDTIDENKKEFDDFVEKKYNKHVDEFANHKDEGSLNITKLMTQGAGWLVSGFLALALVWALFGQNVRLP